MKRITLLLAAVALLVGSAATAQDLRREERTMKRYGQQAENEMRREMRGVRAEERRAETRCAGRCAARNARCSTCMRLPVRP